MIQVDRIGIYLSKPISVLLVLIYLIQSGLLIYLVRDKFELQRQINFQQQHVDELEERLQVLNAVKDLQIGFNDKQVRDLGEVIFTESKKYRYDPMFVMALILTESSFRKGQVSPAGALGLMQVMPWVGADVAERAGIDWEGYESLLEPETNIQVGTRHLFEQILKFDDIEKAIVAYNVGETRLRGLIRQGKKPPREYLKRVMENYSLLKERYST
ncbi:MAG: lytic transglycosylase domain-containing protein [bacterium]